MAALKYELYHYGIKGMKWKKRKKKTSELERAGRNLEYASRAGSDLKKQLVEKEGTSSLWNNRTIKEADKQTATAKNNVSRAQNKKIRKAKSIISNLFSRRKKEALDVTRHDPDWEARKYKQGRGGFSVTKFGARNYGARYTRYIPNTNKKRKQ